MIESDLDSLVMSIESSSLTVRSPPLVRFVNGRYQIVSGHRRVAAARKAGLKMIWCRVEELSDEDVMREIVVENANRVDLDWKELYEGLDQYRRKLGLESDFYSELSRRTGLSDSWIGEVFDAHNIREKLNIPALGGKEPSVDVIEATRGLEEEERVKLVEKAVIGDWRPSKVREIKRMNASVRKGILRDTVQEIQPTLQTNVEQSSLSDESSQVSMTIGKDLYVLLDALRTLLDKEKYGSLGAIDKPGVDGILDKIEAWVKELRT
jgi:ParB family chromosome partitioning protein